ncbi:MAG: NAD(P)-binding domain-containing protein [Bacteroidota bacterium]|uniref:SDR family NAD(P)-dependent oxidoreductase n=1 Tax=Flagellimonas okinawensis TaxID=3031324 RepID=A0ABT5XPV5_9FLAO|nr:NAD(P)-binding domain-containing protein [[Muricauda] okinawensis]MDF0707832.1 SDR family NAD(P)-dependent oxidoreductase [[Muricauda] okinawensis]MEC8830801.1 NAD(P)-binding domain-containing protein [Bacteroidota bacterium]
MSNKIGVLGCGWLGLPLAVKLIEKGYLVKGTTTTDDKVEVLKTEEIVPYKVKLSENGIQGDITGFLEQIGTLIIDVPPKLRGEHTESFVEKMKFLLKEIEKSQISHILFVSSTAVYGNAAGKVSEDSPVLPVTESGKQLVESEKLFRENKSFKTTIIRFGGLIGNDRHPVTMLSGRKDLSGGNHPINLIHRKDCIHMIITILENAYWDRIFNGVYPHHPKKQVYYFEEAQKRGLPAPTYKTNRENENGKIVLSLNFEQLGHTLNTTIVS